MDERVLIHVGEVGGVGEPAAQPAKEQRADVLEDGAVGLAVAGLRAHHPVRPAAAAASRSILGPRPHYGVDAERLPGTLLDRERPLAAGSYSLAER
jgi:hypothetical protein